MPRKFRRVVRKGGVQSKKTQHQILTGIRDQVDLVSSRFAEMAVQTDKVELREMATQTDINFDVVSTEASMQTENPEYADMFTQTDNESIQQSTVGIHNSSNATELVKCEGNNDDKFLPLVNKHKGIFKDVTGKDYNVDSINLSMLC